MLAKITYRCGSALDILQASPDEYYVGAHNTCMSTLEGQIPRLFASTMEEGEAGKLEMACRWTCLDDDAR